MAEGKKSFIVYVDSKDLVDRLPNDKAGELFKMLFAYTNDENPQTDDLLLQIAFEHFKQKLKTDLKKWEGKKKEKSEAGILGNLKRWNEDLYDKVKNNELTIKEAENIAKHRTAIKPIAEIAVNGNVNVKSNTLSSDSDETKKLKYKDEFEFLIDWNDARRRILHKESNINKLTNFELLDFRQLNKEFTISDFKNGIRGLMMQKGIYDSSTTRPKHFLSDRNIEKYIDAHANKTQIYQNKKQEQRL